MKSESEIADAAERFAKVAESFCSVVDSAPGHDRMQFVLRIYEVLPRLIGEAAGLPNVGLDSDESEDDSAPAIEAMHAEIQEDARLHHLQWKPLYGSLKGKFGDWDLYWAVFDPTTNKRKLWAARSRLTSPAFTWT